MTNEKVQCTDVMAGTHWQHRNGNKYEVLFLANVGAENDDTNDYETTVVYRGENGKLWTRPLSDWSRSMTIKPCRNYECRRIIAEQQATIEELRRTAAATPSPQADKARGEWPRDWRAAIRHAIELVETEREWRELDGAHRARFTRSATVLNAMLVTTPQPQGDASPEAGVDAAVASTGHISFNSMTQCADSWLAVVDVLDKVCPNWSAREGTGRECAITAIRELATPQVSGGGEDAPVSPWKSINLLDTNTDDLFWFLRGDTIDGPRSPQLGGYDSDEWDYFAPAVHPPIANLSTPQARPVTMSNDGNSEAEFIGWHALNCPACGGSGHKDDVPATVSIIRNGEQARPDGGAVAWMADDGSTVSEYARAAHPSPTAFAEYTTPLYTHPAPAPDVARLVELLNAIDADVLAAEQIGERVTHDDIRTCVSQLRAAAQQGAANGQE